MFFSVIKSTGAVFMWAFYTKRGYKFPQGYVSLLRIRTCFYYRFFVFSCVFQLSQFEIAILYIVFPKYLTIDVLRGNPVGTIYKTRKNNTHSHTNMSLFCDFAGLIWLIENITSNTRSVYVKCAFYISIFPPAKWNLLTSERIRTLIIQVNKSETYVIGDLQANPNEYHIASQFIVCFMHIHP